MVKLTPAAIAEMLDLLREKDVSRFKCDQFEVAFIEAPMMLEIPEETHQEREITTDLYGEGSSLYDHLGVDPTSVFPEKE